MAPFRPSVEEERAADSSIGLLFLLISCASASLDVYKRHRTRQRPIFCTRAAHVRIVDNPMPLLQRSQAQQQFKHAVSLPVKKLRLGDVWRERQDESGIQQQPEPLQIDPERHHKDEEYHKYD